MGTTPKLTRTGRAHADETRRAIVDAAIPLFAERSFDGVSFRDVAHASSRPLGVVSYHFPSKDDLWRAAATSLHQSFVDHFDSAADLISTDDPLAEARDTIRVYVRYFAKDPQLFRFMIQLSLADNERLRWYVATFGKPFRQRFELLLDELSVQNGLVKDDPRFTMLFYSLIGAATLIYATAPEVRLTQQIDPDQPDLVDAHIDILLERFLPGRPPSKR